MRKTFPVCWASAKEAVDNRAAANRQIIIFVFIVSASPLSNHLIRSCQDVRWDSQPDLFRRLQVDDELEFFRLLDREIGGLRAFEDFVHVSRGTAVEIGHIHAVEHETASLHILWSR